MDGDTNWYTITTFRQLAINAAGSVSKGDRVVATGRLRIREWENGERTGTTVDIEADALGPDLAWGTAAFSRSIASAVAVASSPAQEEFPAAVSLDEGKAQLSDPGDPKDQDDAAHLRDPLDAVSAPF